MQAECGVDGRPSGQVMYPITGWIVSSSHRQLVSSSARRIVGLSDCRLVRSSKSDHSHPSTAHNLGTKTPPPISGYTFGPPVRSQNPQYRIPSTSHKPGYRDLTRPGTGQKADYRAVLGPPGKDILLLGCRDVGEALLYGGKSGGGVVLIVHGRVHCWSRGLLSTCWRLKEVGGLGEVSELR